MIILFVLVGLVLLGGGVATIFDGLPYLVLERGFTQVIVGAVAAMGGVLLLALSCVLVELRRVRKTLSNAMMAVSMASMSGKVSAPATAPGTVASMAGAGLAAGVGAALIAARASKDGAPEAEPETGEKPDAHEVEEPDLFARALSDADWQAADAEASEAEELHEPSEMPAHDEATRSGEVAAEAERPDDVAAPAAQEAAAEIEETAPDSPAAEFEPSFDQPEHPQLATETLHDTASDHGRRTEPRLEWPEPEPDVEPAAEPQDVKPKPEPDDEFGYLRASLAGRLTGSEPGDDERRAEALRESEAWMTPSGSRREPWFEQRDTQDKAPVAREGEDVSAAFQPPPWPPQTREPAIAESRLEALDEASAVEPAETALAEPPPVEDVPSAPEPEPAPPAASNEGVIGAYQVGDAHFTIFADGSIKARTPDGDYNFASMEELKTYLASEKSRLGV